MRVDDDGWGCVPEEEDGFFTRRVCCTFVSGCLGSLPLLRRLPLLTLFESLLFGGRLFGKVTATAKGSKSAVGAIKNPSSSIKDAFGTAFLFGLAAEDEYLDVVPFDG